MNRTDKIGSKPLQKKNWHLTKMEWEETWEAKKLNKMAP